MLEPHEVAGGVASGQELGRFMHDRTVWAVAFSPDGGLLATASADGSARVWQVSGQERARVAHEDIVRTVAFSPDGRLMATGSYDHSARVWALVQ